MELTWDETNPERQEIAQKLSSGKTDDIDPSDIQAYLASGSSDEAGKFTSYLSLLCSLRNKCKLWLFISMKYIYIFFYYRL